jgi:hypothetical protein
MCLITLQQTPSIAEEDITVYKILHRKSKSTAYQYFEYEVGKLYLTEIEIVQKHEKWLAFDKIALKWLDSISPNWSRRKPSNLICIEKGFHSAMNSERLTDKNDKKDNIIYNFILWEFIIPKGSEYYVDGTGLCVSNQIIMKENGEVKHDNQ